MKENEINNCNWFWIILEILQSKSNSETVSFTFLVVLVFVVSFFIICFLKTSFSESEDDDDDDVDDELPSSSSSSSSDDDDFSSFLLTLTFDFFWTMSDSFETDDLAFTELLFDDAVDESDDDSLSDSESDSSLLLSLLDGSGPSGIKKNYSNSKKRKIYEYSLQPVDTLLLSSSFE